MFVAQLEYRYPIYKRFSGVAFGSISEVGASLKQLLRESLKPAAGFGLRYQLTKEERSLLRLDLGFTKEGNALYITINDAF
jgi:outer membrane translocation and assembly module TamA